MNQKTWVSQHKITLLILIYGLEGIAANLAHPVTPKFLESINMPNYMFGIVFAAMSLTNFAFSPFWGNLCNHISSKKLLLISCVGYGVGQLIFGFSTHEFIIIMGRFVSGFFVAGITVAVSYYIMKYSDPETKSRNITASITTFTVAGTFGYFIGGFIGNYSIMIPFVAQFFLLALSGVLFYLVLDNNEVEHIEDRQKLIKNSNPVSAFVHIKPYLTPSILLLFVIVLSVSSASTSLTQSYSYYLQNTLNVSPFINGLTKGIVGLVALGVNFTITVWILRKRNVEKHLVYFFGALTSVVVAMILFAGNAYAFVILGIVAMVMDTMQISMLQDRNAKYATAQSQGAMIGMHNAMKGLGAIAGSLISGFIYDVNPIYPFILAAVLYFITILVTGTLAKRLKLTKSI